MQIGEQIKINLHGEAPWATILKISGDKIKVKIINKLFHEYSEHEQAQFTNQHFNKTRKLPNLHGKKQGDVFWCERDEYGEWKPCQHKEIDCE